jgi:hypothetical protein
VKQLLALRDRIIVGMNDLQFNSQTLSGMFGSGRLFLLVVVIVVG